MYPEFMGGDDTEDTNAEKRPLYTLMDKDNNNLSFGHTWCFMPSKALWVFLDGSLSLSMLCPNYIPAPGTATKRVELIASDADPQETKETAIKNEVYPSWTATSSVIQRFAEMRLYTSCNFLLCEIKAEQRSVR